ncbi:MAG TPA: dihydropyrimidinase [Chloroflexota bacterium]|nr:dihydropyrimidinase [Chloroflexota bacterium]
MDLVIANGTVVTATETYRADVGVADGKIVQIGGAMPSDVPRLDATDRYVVPGGVDPHTHFDGRSQGTSNADDWLSGTTAAACGGTTAVVDMCFPERGGTLRAGVDEWHRRADGKAIVDYGFHVTVLDESAAVAAEIPSVPDLGVSTLKLFMAYRGSTMVSDATLYRALRLSVERGLLCLVHAENGDAVDLRARELVAAGKTAPKYHAGARPPRVEAEATARAVALAELAGAPLYVVHVSCAEALEEIERGRARGVEVYAETCPQYLFCSADDLDRPNFEGAKYVCSPALRERWQQDVLWGALRDGRVQVVASDHSAYNFGQPDHKPRGRDDFTKIPNGVPGAEERMTLVYQGVVQGKLSLSRWVEVVATNPARIHGLAPRKGTIAVGADADLVLWDPSARWTLTQPALHHKVDYTAYEGLVVQGAPDVVLSRGEVIVRGRQPVAKAGRGRFLRRQSRPVPTPVGA